MLQLYVLFMQLIKLCFQDVCKIVVNYCHLLKQRVRVLSENSDHSIAINMVTEHIFLHSCSFRNFSAHFPPCASGFLFFFSFPCSCASS